MPSTPKCGKCDYYSEDEEELNDHMNSVHLLSCDFCNFQTEKKTILETHMKTDHINECTKCDYETKSEEDLNIHMNEEHTFCCNKCQHISKNKEKHTNHTCKVYIRNPTFETFYTKEWLNGNGCNAIYCSELKEDVIWLQSERCWTNEHPCYFTPCNLQGRKYEPGYLHHIKFSRFVEDKIICWESMKMEMEKISSHQAYI